MKHTPDLVMDLPGDGSEGEAESESASITTSGEECGTSPTTAAECFAHNQHTLKKRPTKDSLSSEKYVFSVWLKFYHSVPIFYVNFILRESSSNNHENHHDETAKDHAAVESKLITPTSVKDECQKSPVPPRNTQRVAAKFADLTLTGGSLKPQIAAKPMVLRKPIPTPEDWHSAQPSDGKPSIKPKPMLGSSLQHR